MAYGNMNGSSIGSLLRFIQEQKSQSPIIPPSTEVGSPVRGVVQEPLKGPESIGTEKVMGLKPEGIAGTTGESGQPITPGGIAQSAMAGDRAAQRTSFGWTGIGGEDVSSLTPSIVKAQPSTSAPGIGTVISQANQVFSKSGENITPQKAQPVQQGQPSVLGATGPTPVLTSARPYYGPTTNEIQMGQTQKAIEETNRQIARADNPPQTQKAVQDFGTWFRGTTGQKGTPASQTTPTPTPTPAPKQPTYTAPAKPSIAQQIATVIQQSPWSWLFRR